MRQRLTLVCYRLVGFVVTTAVLTGCQRPQNSFSPATPPPLPTPLESSTSSPEERAAAQPQAKPLLPSGGVEAAPQSPIDIAHEFRAAAEADRRGELAEELWKIGTPEALETLRQLFTTERETDVKVDIISGIGEADRPEVRDGAHSLLLAALTPGQPPEVRSLAAHLLTESQDPRALVLLQQFAQDGDPQVREAAREALEARREQDLR